MREENELTSKRSIVIVCNALDDVTRIERRIVTDSPAASRKMFLLAKTLCRSGAKVVVLSMGRGRQDSSGHYSRGAVKRVDGILVLYAPFLHRPLASELLSFFSLGVNLWRLWRRRGQMTAIFYNRLPAYLLALLVAVLLRYRTVLDLEDGEVGLKPWSMKWFVSKPTQRLYDLFCSGGALIACKSLGSFTSLKPTQCYYGTVETQNAPVKWSTDEVKVLLGGTVSRDTGALLLAEAVRMMRKEQSAWKKLLCFEITGKGDCLAEFQSLALSFDHPRVNVHGRMNDSEYRTLAGEVHVGLSLRPNQGILSNSTFPSKVVEMAAAGLLVLTTDTSDVRHVLGDGAIYVERDDAYILANHLRWIVENRCAAEKIAEAGSLAVWRTCGISVTSKALMNFLS
jgi:glycosyltransferase involved in cell wall biosynthesis